jgi:2-hydroxy-3-keto-5-methylthiopentenyl-1-phosphate phosphatase
MESFKDFEKYITVYITIDGLFLIDNDEDKNLKLKIDLSKFKYHINMKKDHIVKCDIIRSYIEENVKKYIIQKIKEKDINVIEVSKKYDVPVKNILYTIFINNRIDNIDILWSSSSLKEFLYVPLEHYLDNQEDSLYLRTKKFKFTKSF